MMRCVDRSVAAIGVAVAALILGSIGYSGRAQSPNDGPARPQVPQSRIDSISAHEDWLWGPTDPGSGKSQFVCRAEIPPHVLAYFKALGIADRRIAERELIARMPDRACRVAHVLHLKIRNGRVVKFFDEGDAPGGLNHFLADYWPDLDSFRVDVWYWGKDVALSFLVNGRDGAVASVEGTQLFSPARRAILYYTRGTHDDVRIVAFAGGTMTLQRPNLQPAFECGIWDWATSPRWLGDTSIDFGEVRQSNVTRRLLLQRVEDGSWTWKCG